MSGSDPLLELRQVTKQFGSAGVGPGSTAVLAELNLRVAAGETLAIVGPSGSGKSTLLNIAGTLEPPSSGQVLWQGRDLAQLAEAELALHRNREIGFVFQQHHLLPQCSALENVLLPTLAQAAPEGSPHERAAALLQRVGLGERMQHRPAELSGGERQRVAVVRALINHPRLLLLDEPTGSLDLAATDALAELLLELNASESVAMVMVTHSDRMARRMQSAMCLVAGSLEALQGTEAE